jgi:hypothetical protein
MDNQYGEYKRRMVEVKRCASGAATRLFGLFRPMLDQPTTFDSRDLHPSSLRRFAEYVDIMRDMEAEADREQERGIELREVKTDNGLDRFVVCWRQSTVYDVMYGISVHGQAIFQVMRYSHEVYRYAGKSAGYVVDFYAKLLGRPK